MSARQCLIDELQSTIASREVRQRADVLRRITDLFVAGSGRYSGEQIALFDDVMCRLLDEIETAARVRFGQQFATMEEPPPNMLRTLALDDSIDVAGPVLSESTALEEAVLVESAKTKGQEHLLAISRRRAIGEAVTDVLVDRGDRSVAISTAVNPGARFSEFGYSTLVRRSKDDGDLALRLWLRPDIPRQHLLQLVSECSEAVRQKIQAADRHNAHLVREMVAEAAEQLQARTRAQSPVHIAARNHVEALKKDSALDEAKLFEFAAANKFDETVVALSVMCDLPIGVVERAVSASGADQLIVLVRAIGLSWRTTSAIIMVGSRSKGALANDFEQIASSFHKLSRDTAEKAIKFYRLRERATK